jgi:hypothetical protein
MEQLYHDKDEGYNYRYGDNYSNWNDFITKKFIDLFIHNCSLKHYLQRPYFAGACF